MAFVTHFESPDGEKLPIAASTLVTVEIPAAGSADKGGWMQAAESTTAHYNQQAGHDAPKSSAVIPHCTDPSVFTDHGLRIDYEEQLQGWVLWIDSLPETACTLTLVFINHSTEGTPCVLPALGVGGGGGLPVVRLSTPIEYSFEPIILNESDKAQIESAMKQEAVILIFTMGAIPYTVTCGVFVDFGGLIGQMLMLYGSEAKLTIGNVLVGVEDGVGMMILQPVGVD